MTDIDFATQWLKACTTIEKCHKYSTERTLWITNKKSMPYYFRHVENIPPSIKEFVYRFKQALKERKCNEK